MRFVIIAGLAGVLIAPPVGAQVVPPASTQAYKFSPGAMAARSRTFSKQLKEDGIVVKAQGLDPTRVRGLRLITSGKPIRFEQLTAYFSSREELAGAIFTALVAQSLQQAPAKDRARMAEAFAVELKSSGASDLTGAQLLDAAKALPGPVADALRRAPTPVAKALAAESAKFSTHIVAGRWSDLGRIDFVVPKVDCTKPFTSATWSASISDSFTWSWSVRYPCGMKSWIPPKVRWCTKSVSATFSFYLGCSVGAQMSCCGGQAWGTCSAQTCALGVCAGCSGGVGAGVGSVTQVGSTCAYGLPLLVDASCSIFGQTVFDASYQLSPYAVTGPCPPAGVCP